MDRTTTERPGFTRDQDNGYSRTPGDLPVGMSNSSPMPPTNGIGGMVMPEIAGGSLGNHQAGNAATGHNDAWLLKKALDIYTNSKNYMEANITLTWERNLYHFRNEHGPGTPYTRADWRRARTFRPKTRANVKAQEASHAAAAFSTADYLQVSAVDPSDDRQCISAQITKALVQNRLRDAPWNWFITAQGAYQDTKNYGICVSHQYWQYEQVEEVIPAFDDDGDPVMGEHEGEKVPMGEKKLKTLFDQPVCDLFPPECFLFDPMCDWRNPAQSSPYIAAMFGMYAVDVLSRMKKAEHKTGQPLWRRHSLEEILATRKENVDNRTRRAREGHHRIDPTMETASREYTMVWAHLNIAREEGVDIAWWTLGTQIVLTDPVPLTEMYPHLGVGERPFVMGFSVVEAHRNYPAGDVEQIAPLQEEINAVANQRLDNVRLVLNKRYFIRRGSQMDLDALMRNVPGGGVMTNDPEKDVQIVNTPDVTSSAYQEQDRLSADLDELVGGFGQQAAAGAGKMVDRAGSLDTIQGAAGAVQDYSIKLFFSTWMEPVLRQFVKMEQMYETDQTLLAIAAKNSNLWIRYGESTVSDEYLQQDLVTVVDVGMGNTDPVKRIQKLTFGIGQTMQLPDMARRIKSAKVADEIFGALGYKDASRFFMNDQELQEHMKTTPPPPPPPEIAVKMAELQQHGQVEQMRDKRETTATQLDHQHRMAQLQQQGEFEHVKLQTQEAIADKKDKTLRDIGAAKEANRLAEVNMERAHKAREFRLKASQPAGAPGEGGTPGKPKPEAKLEPKPEPKEKPEDHVKPIVEGISKSHKELADHIAKGHQALVDHLSKMTEAMKERHEPQPQGKRTKRGTATLPSGGKMNFEINEE